MIKGDIIIAHPHRHHIYHSVLGAIQSGLKVCYIPGLYVRKWHITLSKLAKNSRLNKLKEYRSDDIPDSCIYRIPLADIKKIISKSNGMEYEYARWFDSCIANKISSGEISGKIFYSFHNHMPLSSIAAKKAGMKVVNEWIIHSSQEANRRMNEAYKSLGMKFGWKEWQDGDLAGEEKILINTDVVICPNKYVKNGLLDRFSGEIYVAPYGVSRPQNKNNSIESEKIRIVARANSIRKGGHCLLRALARNGGDWGRGKNIDVFILGNIESSMIKLLDEARLKCRDRVNIEQGEVSHADAISFISNADIFIMPSLNEGMSLAALEAAQFGINMVCSPFCGIDEYESIMNSKRVDTDVDGIDIDRVMNDLSQSKLTRNSVDCISLPEWRSFSNAVSHVLVNKL